MAEADIYNRALSVIGAKASVVSVSDQSVEAETCTLWYQTALEKVLQAAPWTCASAITTLTLSVTRDPEVAWAVTDPPPGFLYSYALPTDLIAPRYLTDYGRFTVGVNVVDAKRLYTNTEDAILIYTKRQNNLDNWDPEFESAVTFTLAAMICTKLTGKNDRLKQVVEQANALIMNARLTDANSQETHIDEFTASWHSARGFGIANDPRYVYPFGPLVNLGWF